MIGQAFIQIRKKVDSTPGRLSLEPPEEAAIVKQQYV